MNLARGTTPPGVASEEQAARWVRGMFGRVARRYDLLNHLLSFQLDRLWRARTAQRVSEVLNRPGARVLDLCCGTGDLTLALAGRRGGLVYGADFCHPMLVEARRKTGRRPALVFEADALRLPLADASLDLITVAFGLRNFANYRQGLEELRRVLRPGGMLAILEFSRPPHRVLARLYSFYSARILPRIGGLISGAGDAYTYLPESVDKFPGAEALAEEMRAAGYSSIEFERMTFGVVSLHIGRV
ncbi:MAG: class I SAM-dependent methyltransferase [Bryobacteraceae bacterium]|jgi:demethylmenaquinone methyltransferase/2-methoxy-6-polyprenyl-1,4-benzoquinol methylase